MSRNTPHKSAQHQLQQAITTGVPALDFVDDTSLNNISTDTGTYKAGILAGDTEVHAGNRIADVLIQSRKNTSLDLSCAIEVIDTSPPDYTALTNHLRSGYSISLVYIVNEDDVQDLTNRELVESIDENLFVGDYTPGWINLTDQKASLGDILSLDNTSYVVKSWVNELTPRLNSNYTWTYEETVSPSIPVSYPVTRVGMFDAIAPGCLDGLRSRIYTGYHDHNCDDPVVYLVDKDQEYIKLEYRDLQTIQNKRALRRVTPLPGQSPYF